MEDVTIEAVLDSMLQGDWAFSEDHEKQKERIEYIKRCHISVCEDLIEFVHASSAERLRSELTSLSSEECEENTPEYFRLGFIHVYLCEVLNFGHEGGDLQDKAGFVLGV